MNWGRFAKLLYVCQESFQQKRGLSRGIDSVPCARANFTPPHQHRICYLPRMASVITGLQCYTMTIAENQFLVARRCLDRSHNQTQLLARPTTPYRPIYPISVLPIILDVVTFVWPAPYDKHVYRCEIARLLNRAVTPSPVP